MVTQPQLYHLSSKQDQTSSSPLVGVGNPSNEFLAAAGLTWKCKYEANKDFEQIYIFINIVSLSAGKKVVYQDQSSREVIPLYNIANSLVIGQATPAKAHRTYCPMTHSCIAFCYPCIFFSMHSRATL